MMPFYTLIFSFRSKIMLLSFIKTIKGGSSRVDLQACKLGTGPSFYNVVTGKTLALPNLIALQHIPLSPAGV
jgi:hypothetical protein